MAKYTAFCQESNGSGTTWIGSVEAHDEESAKKVARMQCAEEWLYEYSEVFCVGLAEGEVNILFWQEPWEQIPDES